MSFYSINWQKAGNSTLPTPPSSGNNLFSTSSLFARANPLLVILIILTLTPSHVFLFFSRELGKGFFLEMKREGEKEERSEKSRKVGGREKEKGKEGDGGERET